MNQGEMFLAAISCVETELDTKDRLDEILAEYNNLFVPGSNKKLALITEEDLDRMRKVEEENRLLFSGLAACVISTGQDRLFIPYSILSKKYQVEIFRDPERPMGYTVTAKLAQDGA